MQQPGPPTLFESVITDHHTKLLSIYTSTLWRILLSGAIVVWYGTWQDKVLLSNSSVGTHRLEAAMLLRVYS